MRPVDGVRPRIDSFQVLTSSDHGPGGEVRILACLIGTRVESATAQRQRLAGDFQNALTGWHPANRGTPIPHAHSAEPTSLDKHRPAKP